MLSPNASNSSDDLHSILSRVSSLETGLESLSNDVHSLARSLDNFASETRTAIQSLSTKMAESQKTSWSTLAAWGTLILAICTLAGSGFIRDINRIEATVEGISGTRWSSRHHSDWVDRTYHRDVDEINDEIKRLNRLVHDHQKDGHPASVIEQVNALKDRINKIEQEQQRRSSKVYGTPRGDE